MANDNVIELIVKMVDEATGPLTRLSGAISGLGKLAGIAFAGFSLKQVIDETIDAENSTFQLTNAIKAVGLEGTNAARELSEFADEVQRTTIFSDNAAKSVEAMGLRLGLSVEVIKEATVAAANLAAANPGQSLEQAGAAVTRALADPLRGIQNLRREHVIFNQQQQFTIEQLAKTGQQAQAQAEILGILKGSYKDAATEARDTLGGALSALKNSFGSLLSNGAGQDTGIVRVVNELADGLITLKEALNGTLKPQAEVSDGMKLFATILRTVASSVTVLASAITNTLGSAFSAVSSIVVGISTAIREAWNFDKAGAGQRSLDALKEGFSKAGEVIMQGALDTRKTWDDESDKMDNAIKKLWDTAARANEEGQKHLSGSGKNNSVSLSIEQLRALNEAQLSIAADIEKFDVQATAPFDQLQQRLYESAVRAQLLKVQIKELTPELRKMLDELGVHRSDAGQQDLLRQLGIERGELEIQAQLGNRAADAIAQYRAQIQLAAAGAKDLDDQVRKAVDDNLRLKDSGVLKDLQEQLALEQLTTKEKERQINLLRLGAGATEDQKSEVEARTLALQLARDQTRAVEDLQGAFHDLFAGVAQGTHGMVDSFLNAFKQILANAAATDLVKALGLDKLSGKDASGNQSSSVLGGVFNALGGLIFGHAGGGSDDRPFWAGENGPELVVPGGTTSVWNQRQLAFAGSSGGVNFAPVNQVTIVANDADQTKAELIRYFTIQSQRDKTELYRQLERNGVGPKRGIR
jgi:hypothetical protein